MLQAILLVFSNIPNCIRLIENKSVRARSSFKSDMLIEALEKLEVCAVSVAVTTLGTLQVKITGSDSRQNFVLRTVSSSLNKITYDDGVEIKSFNINPLSIGAIDITGSDKANSISLTFVNKNLFPGIPDTPANPAIVIRGNNGDDSLFGSDLADSIHGGEGSDVISGRGGNDKLDVGS